MKKILIATFVAVGMMLTAACGDDKPVGPEQEQPENPTAGNPLSGTTWTGHYDNQLTSQRTGNFVMRTDWTLDFMNDTVVSLLAEITSPISEPQYQDGDFAYTIEGSVGHIYAGGEEDTFDYDAVNQTITIDMQMQVNLGEDLGGVVMLGGETTLYRVR